jgi:preprotein translocase subunit SecE
MAEPKTPEKTMEKPPAKPFNLGQFMREVRIEANKVTWPDRREVGVTTGMVIWMVIIAALYLFGVDFTVQHLVRGILNIFA